MQIDRKTMEQALDLLTGNVSLTIVAHLTVIDSLRAALAAPEREPTAWALMKPDGGIRSLSWYKPSDESLAIAAIENEEWKPLYKETL